MTAVKELKKEKVVTPSPSARMRRIAWRWGMNLFVVPLLAALLLHHFGRLGMAIVIFVAVICASQFGLWFGRARGYDEGRRDAASGPVA